MKLNKMFDQFIPAKLFYLPLTLMGACMALLWLLLLTRTHWLTKRKANTKLLMKTAMSNLMGEQPTNRKSWNSWMFSMFVLCLSYNLLSLIPYTFSQTSHLSMTFSLSLPMWLAFQMTGFISNWKGKLSHLLPQGTPMYLVPLMILMETMSLCIQPLTLGFRLGANLLAGHLLIFLCSCVVWEVVSTSNIGALSFMLIFALLILEMAVACIQAAVFLILSKQYLEENLTQ